MVSSTRYTWFVLIYLNHDHSIIFSFKLGYNITYHYQIPIITVKCLLTYYVTRHYYV